MAIWSSCGTAIGGRWFRRWVDGECRYWESRFRKEGHFKGALGSLDGQVVSAVLICSCVIYSGPLISPHGHSSLV